MSLKSIIFLLIFALAQLIGLAQIDTIIDGKRVYPCKDLSEVVVTGISGIDYTKTTSLNIEPYSLKLLEQNSPYNLSDALSRIPGISQMSTGNAISKPVIRGLYGNRILVLLSGLRFDNQQWQDEHGLGISQIGIDRVEVIKGPASLLYGTDAIGGVINIVEEKPLPGSPKTIDFSTRFFSNTLGTLTDAGYKEHNGGNWWRIRVGYENHGDYSDGKGNRVLNSRNRGYYLKTGFGFIRNKWRQDNSYNFSYNQYGFILDDLGSFFAPDKRWSRSMEGPHHNVILNVFGSQNTFDLANSVLKLNVGIQSNVRMEDEGGGQISLNMHLFSALENMRWEKSINDNVRFIANQQFTFENNTNYGGRIIIPDANMVENNASGFFRFYRGNLIVETGIGINHKFIQTFLTRTLNTTDKAIQPFAVNKLAGNAMVGLSYNPSEAVNIKSNLSTGTRAGNLAELASNGLHEGVFRYELGDPNLKPEQNLNADLTLEVNKNWLFFSASGFYNRFHNYIYLSPTNEQFFGFQVFRYKQQNAFLTGGEAILTIKPNKAQWFQWKEAFTSTYGKLTGGGYLPFIPAFKITSSVRFGDFSRDTKYKGLFVEPAVDYVFAQNRAAQFETKTPAYYLVNLNAGITSMFGKTEVQWGISGKNLLNKQYADHLSRLKYYGLYNPGINIVFSVKIKLDL